MVAIIMQTEAESKQYGQMLRDKFDDQMDGVVSAYHPTFNSKEFMFETVSYQALSTSIEEGLRLASKKKSTKPVVLS